MAISALEELLAKNKVDSDEIVTRQIHVERLGKPIQISFRRLSYAKYKFFRKQSVEIKRGNVNFDSDKYRMSVIQSCMTDPDFSKMEFLQAIGAPNGDAALGIVFLPGEIVALGDMILKESGFDDDPFRDDVYGGEGEAEE